MTENEAYAQALRELECNNMDKGTWSKALAFSNADAATAKTNYLRFRAEQLCGYSSPKIKYPRWVYEFWIPSGRRGRLAWFLWGLAHLFLLGFTAGPLASSGSDAGALVAALLFLTWLYLTLVNSAKRLHDLNATGWLSPIVFLPLVPLFFLCLSGTEGMNRFGEGFK